MRGIFRQAKRLLQRITKLPTTSLEPAKNYAMDIHDIDRLVLKLISVDGLKGPGEPNVSSTGEILRDIQLIRSNIKTLAWRIEHLDAPKDKIGFKDFSEALANTTDDFKPTSRICRSSDIYSEWHRALSLLLRADNYKLRKVWEWTFTIKVLHSFGLLRDDAVGLGFGCGTEPLPSVFANFVQHLVATDAPYEVIDGKGWSNTSQHTTDLEKIKYEWLAPREKLDTAITLRYVDMNNIPSELHNNYDFVWSSCALEHLGSKKAGLKFIVDSCKCLKVGGVAIHTTEYDLSSQSKIDNWQTVLFNKEDFTKKLSDQIANLSLSIPGSHFKLLELDLDRGHAFIDGFVDIPPYSYHPDLNSSFHEQNKNSQKFENEETRDAKIGYGYQFPQINLSVDGFPCTSIALVIQRIK